MGSKSRKRKQFRPPAPKKRIHWTWMTCLVYAPLTLLAFGMVFGAGLIQVLNHPDVYHVTAFSSLVLLAVYLSYCNWKTQ